MVVMIIAMNTSIVCVRLGASVVSIITVAIEPGPLMNGIASGMTEMSSAYSSLSSIAFCSSCSPSWCFIIRIAMPNSMRPPAILNAARLIPNSWKIMLPRSANVKNTVVAISTDLFAMNFFLYLLAVGTSDKNTNADVMGFTITIIAASVMAKYSKRPSIILFFSFLCF